MGWYGWFAVALAAVVIITFLVQILLGRIRGFVTRSMIVISAAVVLLALGTGIVAIVGLG